jgi:hypothetical protein
MSSVFFSRLNASGTTSSVLAVEKNRINRANLLVYWLCELTFRGGFSLTFGFIATILSIVAKTRSF